MRKLKKLIAVFGGILLLMVIMVGSAFTDVLTHYATKIREVPVSDPTIMFFLGSGMIGLAVILRKKLFKK